MRIVELLPLIQNPPPAIVNSCSVPFAEGQNIRTASRAGTVSLPGKREHGGGQRSESEASCRKAP